MSKASTFSVGIKIGAKESVKKKLRTSSYVIKKNVTAINVPTRK